MNLHHADKADWETIPPEKWNAWQRLAARTNAFAAPANAISVLGAALVIYGVYLVMIDSAFWGVTFIIVGRCADILDGAVAELTHTKSPLGEAFDATIDKLIGFGAVAALAVGGFIPWIVALGLLITGSAMSAESIYAKRNKRIVHPTFIGKLTTFAAWVIIPLYVYLDYNRDSLNDGLRLLLSLLAAAGYMLYLIGWAVTFRQYVQQARDQRK